MIATAIATGKSVSGSKRHLVRGPAYGSGAAPARPGWHDEPYSRPRMSAFLRSYSSALMAPRSRRSARLARVRVSSSELIAAPADAALDGAGDDGDGTGRVSSPIGVLDAAGAAAIGGADVTVAAGATATDGASRSGGPGSSSPVPAISRSYSYLASSIAFLNWIGRRIILN